MIPVVQLACFGVWRIVEGFAAWVAYAAYGANPLGTDSGARDHMATEGLASGDVKIPIIGLYCDEFVIITYASRKWGSHKYNNGD